MDLILVEQLVNDNYLCSFRRICLESLLNILFSQQLGVGFFSKGFIKPYDYLYCYGRWGPLTIGPNLFKRISEQYLKDIITVGLQYDPIPSLPMSWKDGISRGYNLTVMGSPVLVDEWDNVTNAIAVVPFITDDDLPGPLDGMVPWEDRPYDFGVINKTSLKDMRRQLELKLGMVEKSL